MATSREEIRQWLERGLAEGASHVIIVCDTFDYDDYPVMVMPNENVKKVAKKYDNVDMQKIMEVYNLNMDINEQLSEQRVRNW